MEAVTASKVTISLIFDSVAVLEQKVSLTPLLIGIASACWQSSMLRRGSLTKLLVPGCPKGAPTFSPSIVASTTFADIVVGSSLKRACRVVCTCSPVKYQNRVFKRIDLNKCNTPVMSDISHVGFCRYVSLRLSDPDFSKGDNPLDGCETDGP